MRKLDSLTEQQAKLNWLGEEMSSVFHRELKMRKGKSSIMFLFDENRVKVEEGEELNDLIIAFHVNLLARDGGNMASFYFPKGKIIDNNQYVSLSFYSSYERGCQENCVEY